MIIIPFLNGYNWECTLFSDKPIWWGFGIPDLLRSYGEFGLNLASCHCWNSSHLEARSRFSERRETTQQKSRILAHGLGRIKRIIFRISKITITITITSWWKQCRPWLRSARCTRPPSDCPKMVESRTVAVYDWSLQVWVNRWMIG